MLPAARKVISCRITFGKFGHFSFFHSRVPCLPKIPLHPQIPSPLPRKSPVGLPVHKDFPQCIIFCTLSKLHQDIGLGFLVLVGEQPVVLFEECGRDGCKLTDKVAQRFCIYLKIIIMGQVGGWFCYYCWPRRSSAGVSGRWCGKTPQTERLSCCSNRWISGLRVKYQRIAW